MKLVTRPTQTKAQTNARLDEATLAQYTFKPGLVRNVAVAIATALHNKRGQPVWADEVALPELQSFDKNLIGLAWRNLTRWGIIARIEEQHRRSKVKSRNGGIAFQYRAPNWTLLEVFLARNSWCPRPTQGELL